MTRSNLIGFVYPTCSTYLQKCCSDLGCVFIYNDGAIVYKSTIQMTYNKSSTGAEFITVVSATKAAGYIYTMLLDLQISEAQPTPVYEDNQSAIKFIDHKIQNHCSGHKMD